MRRILVIAVVLAVVACITVAFVFYATGDLVRTADAFLTAVKKDDFAAARGYLAEDFKANTDEAALREFLARSAIVRFKKASWSERSVSSGRGELNGSITTEAGGTIPIKLTFVKESGGWRIFSLHKPTAGLSSEDTPRSVPTTAEQVALVKHWMHEFALAINAKSFEQFRSGVSEVMQRTYTTEQFNESFAAVMDSGDLTVLDPVDPILDEEANLDESGMLTIRGHYATSPKEIGFEQKYIYEGTEWKLITFNIAPR